MTLSPSFLTSIIGVDVSWQTSVTIAMFGFKVSVIIWAPLSPISSCTELVTYKQKGRVFLFSFNNLATSAIINPPILLSIALQTNLFLFNIWNESGYVITHPTWIPIFSTSFLSFAPTSIEMFSSFGGSSFPGVLVWIAGHPKTPFTTPFLVWILTHFDGAIWWSLPPFRITYIRPLSLI